MAEAADLRPLFEEADRLTAIVQERTLALASAKKELSDAIRDIRTAGGGTPGPYNWQGRDVVIAGRGGNFFFKAQRKKKSIQVK